MQLSEGQILDELSEGLYCIGCGNIEGIPCMPKCPTAKLLEGEA
jgi:coenzyme F420-reducing hydrogenase gamma subunit